VYPERQAKLKKEKDFGLSKTEAKSVRKVTHTYIYTYLLDRPLRRCPIHTCSSINNNINIR